MKDTEHPQSLLSKKSPIQKLFALIFIQRIQIFNCSNNTLIFFASWSSLQVFFMIAIIAIRQAFFYLRDDYFVRALGIISNFFTLRPSNFDEEEESGYSNTMAYVLGVAFIFAHVVFMASWIALAKKKFVPNFLIKYLSWYSYLHPNILFLPMSIKLMQLLSERYFMDTRTAQQSAEMWLIGFANIVNIVEAFLLVRFFTDNVNYKTKFAVRSRNLYMAQLLTKAALSVCTFMISDEYEVKNLIMDGLMIFFSIAVWSILFISLPFYNFKLNRIPVLVFTSSVVFAIIASVLDFTDINLSATFSFIPYFMITSSFLYRIIKDITLEPKFDILAKQIYNPASPDMAMRSFIQIKSIIENLNVELIPEEKHKLIELQGKSLIATMRRFFDGNPDVKPKDMEILEQYSSNQKDLIENGAQHLLVMFLKHLLVKFPKNVEIMLALVSQILTIGKNENYYDIISYLYRAETQSITNTQRFVIKMIKKEVLESIHEINAQTNDVIALDKVLNQNTIFDNLHDLIRKEADLHSNFWGHLKDIEVSATTLQKLGYEIEDNHQKIEKAWLSIDDHEVQRSNQFYFLYGIYLIMLRNNPLDGLDYIQRGQYLRDDERRFFEVNKSKFFASNLLSDNSALLTIATSKSHFGVIKHSTEGCKRVFGYTVDTLVGRKINTLMPTSISIIHDKMMLGYLENGDPNVLNKNRRVLALDNKGYLIPILMNIQAHPFGENGFSFLALCRSQNLTSDLILMDINGHIESISEQFSQKISLPIQLLGKQKLSIKTISAGFNKHIINRIADVLQMNPEEIKQDIGDQQLLKFLTSTEIQKYKDALVNLENIPFILSFGEYLDAKERRVGDMLFVYEVQLKFQRVYHNSTIMIIMACNHLMSRRIINSQDFEANMLNTQQTKGMKDFGASRSFTINQNELEVLQTLKTQDSFNNKAAPTTIEGGYTTREEENIFLKLKTIQQAKYNQMGNTNFLSSNFGNFFNHNDFLTISQQFVPTCLSVRSGSNIQDGGNVSEGSNNYIPSTHRNVGQEQQQLKDLDFHFFPTDNFPDEQGVVGALMTANTEGPLYEEPKTTMKRFLPLPVPQELVEDEEMLGDIFSDKNNKSSSNVHNFQRNVQFDGQVDEQQAKRGAFDGFQQSSTTSKTSNSSRRMHQAVSKALNEHFSPFTVSILGRGLLLLIAVAIPIMVWLQIYTQNLVDELQYTMGVINLSEERLGYYIETVRRCNIARLNARELMDRYTRHIDIGITDFQEFNRANIAVESINMLEYNGQLRGSLSSLKARFRDKFYEFKTQLNYTAKYGTNPDDILEMKMNTFEAVEEIGYLAQQISRNTNFKEDDSNLRFVLENTLNELLVDLESSSETLEDYLANIIDDYVNQTVVILSCIIAAGVLILGTSVIYNTIVYKQIVYRFLEAFLKISSADIEFLHNKTSRFARKIEKALVEDLVQGSMYETADLDSFHIATNSKKSSDLSSSNIMNRNRKYDKKKRLKTSGFLLNALKDALIIFTVLLFFTSVMLIYNFLAQEFSERSRKLAKRYSYAVDEVSSIGVQISALYEFLSENGTTTIRDKDVISELEVLNTRVANTDTFYALYSNDGHEINPRFLDLLRGDLCRYTTNEADLAVCKDSELSSNGIFGLKSYYSLAVDNSMNLFLDSNRTEEAQIEAFSRNDLIRIERIYRAFTRPAFDAFEALLLEDYNTYNEEYIGKILILVIISIVLFLILPLVIWKPVVSKITKRYDALKQVVKPVPIDAISHNKGLITTLVKISPESLGSTVTQKMFI